MVEYKHTQRDLNSAHDSYPPLVNGINSSAQAIIFSSTVVIGAIAVAGLIIAGAWIFG